MTVEHPKQTIGISVKDSRNDTLLPGAVVTHIQPGSPVSKHVELGVGDIIVSLDDKSLIGLPFPTILKMLQRAGKKATTTFEFIPSQKVWNNDALALIRAKLTPYFVVLIACPVFD